ncbi:solute carrier family 25 member 46 [Trichonephila clavipes]|nr:solute carrier family 25 member 46 [Trichonephila clavipes]
MASKETSCEKYGSKNPMTDPTHKDLLLNMSRSWKTYQEDLKTCISDESPIKVSEKPSTLAEKLLLPLHVQFLRKFLQLLYLQGTRTIIDDLDSGTSVLPVISTYEGIVDCFHTIVAEEGASGLYKGFGGLLMEYALQVLILKMAQFVFHEIESVFKPANKPISEHST